MEKIEKKLFLLDAYALIFRAYYGFIRNPRFSSSGLNTSAILGFTNTLDEIVRKEKPTHIAVVFDPPPPTFRKKLYPKYKSNRRATPEDILKSVPFIKEIINGYNIPVIEIENFEADDTIGTLAKQAEKEGFTVYMMTPDKDFGQLVSENIFMYKPKKNGNEPEILGKNEICKKYNIKDPLQVIDILAIWGDTVDNIPGIPGVGEKTSIKLISRFKSIEGIYKNIYRLKGKQRENVLKSKEWVKTSKILVTISLDVPVEFNADETKLKIPDYAKLEKIFSELEFKALSKRIIPKDHDMFLISGISDLEIEPIKQKDDINSTKHNYITVNTDEERKKLIELLYKQKEFCFDTETTSVNPHLSELVGISFCFKKHEAYYVHLPEDKDECQKIISEFKNILENESIEKIGQNIKFDIIVLSNYDINIRGRLFDTMIAHYLLNSEKRHNLTYISETILNYTPIPIENLIGKKGKKGKKQMSMRIVSEQKIKEYACEDADITFILKTVLYEKLKKEDLFDLAQNIEFPLIYVLADMEKNGVKIDTEKLNKYKEKLEVKIETIKKEIYSLSGTKFNIASPKQLGKVLFEILKITNNPKLTKTKQYSTSEAELSKLKNKHKIINIVLKFRSLSKLLSTYVNALPLLINNKTGKIHTSYNQAVTVTGRLSSTNPNLQNIPIRTEESKKIRTAFVPSHKDGFILSADYSQIELRIMAHLSSDKNMITAFNNKEDIHSATASKIFEVRQDELSQEMRDKAKSANFGIIYGISASGLAQNLSISRKEAKELINGYFETYPEVKNYMNKSIADAVNTEYVTTIRKRKKYLNNINSRNSLLRSNDERNAINAPIQGSAADIIKIAMINCFERINKENLKSKMIIQVHDELVFDVKKEELESIKMIVKEEMENAVVLKVPLITDTGIGNNWSEAH